MSTLRPIEWHERPYLEAFGRLLKESRQAAGLTQRQLAEKAELTERQIRYLERGASRTRRSTLRRLSDALERPTLIRELLDALGPALAPESAESKWCELHGIGRRRKHRQKKNQGSTDKPSPQPPPLDPRHVDMYAQWRRRI